MSVTIKLNSKALTQSLRLLAAKSNHLPSHLANKACHWIARRAEANMPVVTPARITAEMNATTAAVEMATGKLAPKHLRRNRSMTMAQKIVLARMIPNSPFNIRTGHVFQLQPPPGSGGGPTSSRGRYKLGGQSQTRFREWVDAHATRMVGARRASSGFFKLCATAITIMFNPRYLPSVIPAGAESVEATPSGGKVSNIIGRLVGGRLALGNQTVATASFWVSGTEPDTKGVPGKALFSIAQPIWQRAVDEEYKSTLDRALKLYSETIRSSGLVVR